MKQFIFIISRDPSSIHFGTCFK